MKDKFEAQEAILDDLRSEYQEVDLNLEDMRDQFAAKEKECEKLKDQLGKWMRVRIIHLIFGDLLFKDIP